MKKWNQCTPRQGTKTGVLQQAEDQAARLELLYPPDGAANAVVDIILVAGLGGHYIKTWTAGDGTVWPRDLLPKEIPKIRVLSFQYNTTIKGTTSKGKIADHAGQLLNALHLDRDTDTEAATRPIIFVGHSLGGMLVKYAIRLASEHHRYGSLWDASRGVMFFATPHHGMGISAWRDFAAAVLCLNAPFPGVRPTESMLNELAMNTDTLLRITDDFKPLQPELAFVNFFEGNMMTGTRKVLVDRSHGWMDAPKKQEHQMEGDHIGICQFGRYKTDKRWLQLVLTSMRYLIEQSPKAIDQIDGDAKRALHSLCPTGFHGYFMAKERTEGTCEWISERQDFQEWLDDENDKQMLWIQGPPACGKSYLAKHIITELAPAAKKEVSHCFLSDAVPGRGNIAALLRATLHHALRLEPQLISEILVPPFLESTKNKNLRVTDDDIWTGERMVDMWPEAVARVLSYRPLTLVVDGFDQMDGECQQGFLDCLSECKTRAGDEGTRRLRVLLLSSESEAEGENPLIGHEDLDFQVYHVTPDDTLPDMSKTIMKQLSAPSGHQWLANGGSSEGEEAETLREEMCEAVMQHSNGSYLQAAKAAETLIEAPLMMRDLETARMHIEKLPTNDAGFHIQHLNGILGIGKNVNLLKHVLRWAIFQLEPLREAEFYTAVSLGMTIDQQRETVPQRGAPSTSQRSLEGSLQKAGEVKLLVQTHCQKLVDLREGHLQIAHTSLRKLLTARIVGNVPAREQLNSDLAESMEELSSHAALAHVCIAYLTLSCFQRSDSPVIPSSSDNGDVWKSEVRRRIKNYPFVRYASLNWFRHLEASKRESTSSFSFGGEVTAPYYYPDQDQERLRLLLNKKTGYARCWTEVFWFLTNGGTSSGAEQERLQEFSPRLVIRSCFPLLPASRAMSRASSIHSTREDAPSSWILDSKGRVVAEEMENDNQDVDGEKLNAMAEPVNDGPSIDGSLFIDESIRTQRQVLKSRVEDVGASSSHDNSGEPLQTGSQPKPPVAAGAIEEDLVAKGNTKQSNVLLNEQRQYQHDRDTEPKFTPGEREHPTLPTKLHGEMRDSAGKAEKNQEGGRSTMNEDEQDATPKLVRGRNDSEGHQERVGPRVEELIDKERHDLNASRMDVDEGEDHTTTMPADAEDEILDVKGFQQPLDLEPHSLLLSKAKREPKQDNFGLKAIEGAHLPPSKPPTATQTEDSEPVRVPSSRGTPAQTHSVPPIFQPISPVQPTQQVQHLPQFPEQVNNGSIQASEGGRGTRVEDSPEPTPDAKVKKPRGFARVIAKVKSGVKKIAGR